MTIKSGHLQIDAPYRLDYLYREGNDVLVVLLHGYGQNARGILKLLEDVIPSECSLLVPNGPFPLPTKARTAESLGFAWYFYDSSKDEFYIPYSVPTQLITGLLTALNLNQKKVIVLGYSQGGYLAPFVGEKIQNLEMVISINASFRYEFMEEKRDFPIHAINGKVDDIVEPLLAKQRHEKLIKMGHRGNFHLVDDSAHRIDDNIKAVLKSYFF